MGNLKKGDRIRLTLEADVLYGSSFGVDLAVPAVAGGQFTIREREFSDVEFEKVEPPVEVFKPGDVVRHKTARRFTFALGKYGYLDIVNGVWNDRPNEFTSESYEKVDLD